MVRLLFVLNFDLTDVLANPLSVYDFLKPMLTAL